MSRKRKNTALVMVVLILALGLAGTLAASGSGESQGGFGEDVETSIFLHDDFNPVWEAELRDRDLYVENTGDTLLYVRMRLDEFMKYGGRSLISGGKMDDKGTWSPHIPYGKSVTDCSTEIHEYFPLQMGSEGETAYKSKIRNWYQDKPSRDKSAPASTVLTMDTYMNMTEENRPVNCWVLDSDGYAYWYTQLSKEKATGVLLSGIVDNKTVDESYYYGINARAEAVTEMDLNAWFYGTVPTSGNTVKAEPATELAVKFLKDLSSEYIRITEKMNQTDPKASDFDGDNDGYLTKKEYQKYLKEAGTQNQDAVAINSDNFPDSALRTYISTNLDQDKNDQLTPNEISAVKELNISALGISSLKGIEKFRYLTDLNCSYNHLSKADLSGLASLTAVDASNQSVEMEVLYQSTDGTYSTKPDMFGAGTTFTNTVVSYDSDNKAALVSSYTEGMKSGFTSPLSFGKSRETANLEGTVTFQAKTVTLTKENFPDDAFRDYLKGPDTDNNGILTDNELDAVNVMDLSNRGIYDLTGIDWFTELNSLNISGNHLAKADISKCTKLTAFQAGGQTVEADFQYDKTDNIYKSDAGLFDTGTTFGKTGVTYDGKTGGVFIALAIDDTQFESTFSTPYTFGKADGTLEGTVTFSRNKVVNDVKNTEVSGTVTVENANGSKTDWTVLSKTDSEAVLITKNAVTSMKFYPSSQYPTWGGSDLRNWLNGEGSFAGNGYIDTLSTDMKQVLKKETLKTAHAYNNWTALDSSQDLVYVLTETGKDSKKVAKNPGDSALMTGAQIKCSNTAEDGSSISHWWLRSPAAHSSGSHNSYSTALGTCATGAVESGVVYNARGVRPAVTISLQ